MTDSCSTANLPQIHHRLSTVLMRCCKVGFLWGIRSWDSQKWPTLQHRDQTVDCHPSLESASKNRKGCGTRQAVGCAGGSEKIHLRILENTNPNDDFRLFRPVPAFSEFSLSPRFTKLFAAKSSIHKTDFAAKSSIHKVVTL